MLTPERVKKLRKLKGWTLRELGQKAGLHYSMIFYIEKQKRGLSSASEKKILDAFEIDNVATLERLLALYDYLEVERRGGGENSDGE
ncbi:MAG: hypothetical protein VR72_15125 [Clostridiaceae bacterium BRH_c20a]|nr:MAG: hypothetical protein VR72_15125 [Clostridiaceae bacterium BRH_c20a]